jgi:hypothetical protein
VIKSHPLVSRFTFAVVASALVVFTPIVSIGNAGTAAHAETIGVSIQLLEIKSSQQDDPRARISIVDSLDPGEMIDRRVQVTNASTTPKTVVLYSTSAAVSGGIYEAEAKDNALVGWITTSQSSVNLAPADSAELTVTISVPADAAPGEQYATLWAEVQSDPDPNVSVTNVDRAGLRVYLLVGGDNAAAPDFSIDTLTVGRLPDGSPIVNATVTNNGGRALELAGTLALASGPGGLSAGPFTLDSETALAPGESGIVTVTLDAALPDGPWDATLSLTGSMVTHDYTAQISFDGVVVPDEAVPAWFWVVVAIAVGILTALVALLIGLGIRRHRKSTANRNESVHPE